MATDGEENLISWVRIILLSAWTLPNVPAWSMGCKFVCSQELKGFEGGHYYRKTDTLFSLCLFSLARG